MKPTHALRSFLLGSSLLATATSAHAEIWVWDAGGADNRWGSNANNWVSNTVLVSSASNGVEFYSGSLVAGDLTTFLRDNITIGSLAFNANANLGVSVRLTDLSSGTSARTLTLGSSSVTPTITVDAGSSGNHLIGSSAHGSVILANNLTVTHDGSGTLTIARPVTGATYGITKAGSGTMILSGENTYAGTTMLSGGILSVGSIGDGGVVSGNLGSATNAAAKIVFDGGTLKYTGASATSDRAFTINAGKTATIDTTNDISFAGATGAATDGALTKIGGGKLTLTNTSTYTGATAVNQGTLVVNGNISTSSLTTVASGATIGGTGTVGALSVLSGGFINPGSSPGTLDVVGNYTQLGLYTADINGLIAGDGVGNHDQINVSLPGISDAAVNITGGSLVTMFSTFTPMNGDLIFILLNDETDAIIGTYTGLAQGATVTSYGGFNWQISYVADSVGGTFTGGNDIALMAVPEPRAALLGGLGLLMLLRRRRN